MHKINYHPAVLFLAAALLAAAGCKSNPGSGSSSSSGNSGSSSSGNGGNNDIPALAAALGYTNNTFTSTFDSSQVDMNDTLDQGYKWYISRPFGAGATPVSGITLNTDGSVTLQYNGDVNTGILSAANKGGTWVGSVFGGGGYFEATFKFDPTAVTGSGWPAWWGLPIEKVADLPDYQWPGQAAGYDHYTETDFFEYFPGSPATNWYGSMIDWSGIYSNGYPVMINNWQINTIATSADFRQYHKYGWLWVPATSAAKGYVIYYFDNVQTPDTVSWVQFHTNMTPADFTNLGALYGVIDQEHITLILGSGAQGAMTIQSVKVWQKNGDYNGSNGVIPISLVQ